MRINWDGHEIDVSARAVPETDREHSMPDYVRLEFLAWPLQAHAIMTPADARKLAHEIYDAAMKADSAQQQPELIAFDLDARP